MEEKSLKTKILESIVGGMGVFKVEKKQINPKYRPHIVGTKRKKKPKTYGKNKRVK